MKYYAFENYYKNSNSNPVAVPNTYYVYFEGKKNSFS